MSIIKLTKVNYEVIDRTKTGVDNLRIKSEETILFNTSELIIASTNGFGKAHIKYKEATVNSFDCKETLEDVFKLINKTI